MTTQRQTAHKPGQKSQYKAIRAACKRGEDVVGALVAIGYSTVEAIQLVDTAKAEGGTR